MSSPDPGLQQILLNTCENGSRVFAGGWRVSGARTSVAPPTVGTRVGAVALRFSADAEGPGCKGDFDVSAAVPGECQRLGMWVYLEPNANVSRVGFGMYDGEDESLMHLVEANWTGWKWVELDLRQPIPQAFPQAAKNKTLDQPVKTVHVVWFTRTGGPTSVIVDGLLAQTRMPAQDESAIKAEFLGAGAMEPGRPNLSIALTNFRPQAGTSEISYALRRDSAMFEPGNEASLLMGEVLAEGRTSHSVASRAVSLVPLEVAAELTPGAYLATVRVSSGGSEQTLHRHVFVMPPALQEVSADSRFGLNVSNIAYAPINRRLGVGWVRFENLKWPFVNREEGVYRYDGTVGPRINHDAILQEYAAHELNVTPYLFMTPPYRRAPDAPTDAKGSCYPPADLSTYGEFVFQTVARYGSRKHPADALLTQDKKSGLGLLTVCELWNEPNLNDPGWGHWVGTHEAYLDMFRIGAEAAKKADPDIKVTNGGYAGIIVDIIDRLRSYTYPDGKRPIDFVDILNVHHYCGQSPPELATVDTNVDRSGTKLGKRTYEQDLRELFRWRDKYAPGTPVWLTETGYDTHGNRAVGERNQAAWIPRDVMLALAAGMDKVILFREVGSSPHLYGSCGLISSSGALRPSWFTYATLIRQLDGVTEGIKLPLDDENVRVYAWKRGDQTILSAWAVKGRASVSLKLGACTITDSFGYSQQHASIESLDLSEFPIYISDIGDMSAVASLEHEARRLRAEDDARRDSLASRNAYLFDFGSMDAVGMVEVGDSRLCTPVVAADLWDEERGYGFQPRAALMDEIAGWVRDQLERDSTRINGDMHFRVKVKPGRYQLKIGSVAKSNNAKLFVRNTADGELVFDISRQGTLAEAPLRVTDEDQHLIFATNGYINIRWLTLIEEP